VIFCVETDSELTPRQACDTAFGKRSSAPPPPVTTAPKPTVARRSTPTRQKRKFGAAGVIVLFLSACAFLAAVVLAFGVSTMTSRGAPHDDVLAAFTMIGAAVLIGVLLFALALKARRTQYFDGKGQRVNEDGSALPFIVMGESFGDYDGGDDGFDGGFD